MFLHYFAGRMLEAGFVYELIIDNEVITYIIIFEPV